MTREEATSVLFAMACAKREHAMSLRDLGDKAPSSALTRAALLDEQATALDVAIDALGGAGGEG